MSIGIGDKVRLRIAAYGKPGVVVEQTNGKCRVRWNDLELTTKHAQIHLCSPRTRGVPLVKARSGDSAVTPAQRSRL
jgi:hypothetical protein